MPRLGLRDDPWVRIEGLLPGKQGDRGRAAADSRLFVQAVPWIGRTGGADAVIPPHPSRAGGVVHDRHLYHERHVVACFVAELKHFRRLATRYDTTAISVKAFILLVATLIGPR